MKKLLMYLAVPFVVLLWLVIQIQTFLVVTLYLFRCDVENAKDELYMEGLGSFIKEWFDKKGKWW